MFVLTLFLANWWPAKMNCFFIKKHVKHMGLRTLKPLNIYAGIVCNIIRFIFPDILLVQRTP